MKNAIGLIELNSIAKGFEITDALLKTAESRLVEAHSVCPGKFIVLITGTTADVQSSLQSGLDIAADAFIDKLMIPNIHQDLVSALRGITAVSELEALGIIETFSAASAIIAADAAAKKAMVKLIDIRLANALGGKAYLTLTGEVGAVRSAVNAGSNAVKVAEGILIRRIVIPRPHKDLRKSVL